MDTAIILECNTDKYHTIKSELSCITGLELLFLNNIKKIEVINESEVKTIEILFDNFLTNESTKFNKKTALVLIDNKSFLEYQAYEFKDKVKISDNQNIIEKNILISLAIPKNHVIKEEDSYLYSYFKTEIKSPFNFLLKAKLDLTDDRNNVVKSDNRNDYNNIVINKIPRVIFASAFDYFKNCNTVNYSL